MNKREAQKKSVKVNVIISEGNKEDGYLSDEQEIAKTGTHKAFTTYLRSSLRSLCVLLPHPLASSHPSFLISLLTSSSSSTSPFLPSPSQSFELPALFYSPQPFRSLFPSLTFPSHSPFSSTPFFLPSSLLPSPRYWKMGYT